MEDNIKIIPAKPGYFLLEGLIKIERFDELNYIVKIRSDNAKDKVTKRADGRSYIYKTDGYVRYGSRYFQKVIDAIGYISDVIVPSLVLDDKPVAELNDYVTKLNELRDDIMSNSAYIS